MKCIAAVPRGPGWSACGIRANVSALKYGRRNTILCRAHLKDFNREAKIEVVRGAVVETTLKPKGAR